MRKTFLFSFCLFLYCVSVAQPKMNDELSRLFDMNITEMYRQRLDSLNDEIKDLNYQLQGSKWEMAAMSNALRRANDNASAVVRLFFLLHKIETKQITRQDTSFFESPVYDLTTDTTGPLIIEYRSELEGQIPGWDSLLKAFPYVESLYKKGKLKFQASPLLLMASNAPQIELPPMPALSTASSSLNDKQKIAAEWNGYLAKISTLCDCPRDDYAAYTNMMNAKMEKEKTEFLKKNQRKMTKSELLDKEIELAQKCSFLLEKKYCKK